MIITPQFQMSTPHPIKMRSERSPPNQHRARRGRLRRSRSAPDLMDRAKRTKRVFQGEIYHSILLIDRTNCKRTKRVFQCEIYHSISLIDRVKRVFQSEIYQS